MLSAPGSDLWAGPKRPGAIGEAIFGNKFFPSHTLTPPLFDLARRGPKTFFSETASTAAPRWSTLPLEAQACRIPAVSALARR